jgi:hypothetical protein
MAIVIDGSAGITFPDASVQTTTGGYMNGSQIFTSSGSFTVPLGVNKVWVTGVGGGGSAGNNTSCAGGAGGNGAKAFRQPLNVIGGSVHTVTVGVGGVASSFGSLFTIANGVNGTNATSNAAGTDSPSGSPQWVNGVSAASVDGVSILSAVAGSGLGRARGSGLVGWAGIIIVEW